MVREIVHIQIGQCGNQIGNIFWKTICGEHNVMPNGLLKHKNVNKRKQSSANLSAEDKIRYAKLNVYFSDALTKYVPRAVLVDLEPAVLDTIRAGKYSRLFKPDNFVYGYNGAANNWAKGHYNDGAFLLDEVMDVIRVESEDSDCLQAFQLTHSLGGGTGSGFGTLILERLRDFYPDKINCTYSVFPSPKVSDVVVEPYNAILSSHMLLENSDESFMLDNEALYDISTEILRQEIPTYADLNWLVSMVVSGVTASLRFPGQLNSDLRKMAVNLIPFPRLHFFVISHAPLCHPKQTAYNNFTVDNIVTQMLDKRSFMANVDPKDGEYFTGSITFRGNLAASEVDDAVSKVSSKMADDFVEWIPHNIVTSMVGLPPEYTPLSTTFVGNTKATKTIFQRISSQFTKLFKKRAFVHWYADEGMDNSQFKEAHSNIQDLILEYQEKRGDIVTEDNDEDEFGEEEAEERDEEEEEKEESEEESSNSEF